MRPDHPLPAGAIVVHPRYSWAARLLIGEKTSAPKRAFDFLTVEGPWGTLQVFGEGSPVLMTAEIDGVVLASLQGYLPGVGHEGPVPTLGNRDLDVTVAGQHGGLRFLTEGTRLRLAGRRRFLRATVDDAAWTYGSTETVTASPASVRGQIGDSVAPFELRRGPDPSGAPVAVAITFDRVEGADTQAPQHSLAWTDGALLSELALALVLWQGTSEPKLKPLWWRALNFVSE